MKAKTIAQGGPLTTAAVRAPSAPAAVERDWSQIALNVYLAIFFVYLFAPLLVMSLAAFNAYQYPSVTQWQGWTLKWFTALADDTRMWQGVIHSLVIATGVIVISLPLGLAGVMFMARLQRQDRSLEEAALDLGASPTLVFRRITLPFLAPTIFTAAVIGFLQSIENYNTTVFAIGGDWTLVTEIGSRFRFGLSPVINVIGVIFVAITVIAAAIYVLLRQRELQRAQAR